MKTLPITLVISALCFLAFVPNGSHRTKSQPSKTFASPIDGAWELYSTESGGKTTIHKKPNQIKVYADGHFCMMAYTAEGKFDYATAGTYEFDGKHYKETCTYHSNWPEGIGASLWFDWSKSANGDTLYFSGFKKVIMADGKDVTKDWGGDSFTEKKVRVKPQSMSKIFCFATNGPIWVEFRSENAHVALFCPGLSGYTPLFVPHSTQIGLIFA